jgi:hypothetical protein
MKRWLFGLSLFLNIVFIIGYLLNFINSPTHELGKLKQDVKIGFFSSDSVIFTLPKGLTVRNASENGIAAIGQFENNRFEIVFTSEDELVDYNLNKDSLFTFGNFYSVMKEKRSPAANSKHKKNLYLPNL